MVTAAFCTDIPEFQDGRILEFDYARRFPGAAVVPAMADALRERGWNVVTGDQALRRVIAGDLVASEVYLVQEEDATIGRGLIERGARPALLLCGESPLYATNFYRDLETIAQPFPHRVLFTGAHERAGSTGRNHPLFFPAFHANHERRIVPWDERSYLALLAGNKYWRHAAIPWPDRVKRALTEKLDRQFHRWRADNQLHDARLSLIAHFNDAGKIDVYGTGWDRLSHLPAQWQNRLATLHPVEASIGYEAKHELLAGYKFTVVIENFTYSGYVTEKIFDAIAAATIPIYLGAPDILDFVPKGTFIAARGFDNPADLEKYLDAIDESQALEIIEAGQEFLASPLGQRFSFEDRGRFLADLVDESRTTS